MMNRRNSVAAQRFAERRRREEDAPRLHDQIPNLVSLQLEIEERSGVTGVKHIRRVVVDRAPALFLVPCGDSKCADGEHDFTDTVMNALRAHETSFQGTDECKGSSGAPAPSTHPPASTPTDASIATPAATPSGPPPTPCARVVHFDAIAEYRA